MSVTDLTAIARDNYKDANQVLQYGVRNWGYAIAEDRIPGVASIEKFGENTAAATGETIQDEGGSIVINSTAVKVRIKSGGDAADVAGGAGAEAIEIFGVDGNWNPISETIITKGATVSELSINDYLYVYRARIVDSGAVPNTGNVIIENASAVVYAQITAARGQTQRAVFPVFAGCRLYVTKFRMEGTKTGTLAGEVGLKEYVLGEGVRVIHPIAFSTGSPGISEWDETPKVFLEKTLVWVEVLSLSTEAIITASFDGEIMRYADSTV